MTVTIIAGIIAILTPAAKLIERDMRRPPRRANRPHAQTIIVVTHDCEYRRLRELRDDERRWREGT